MIAPEVFTIGVAGATAVLAAALHDPVRIVGATLSVAAFTMTWIDVRVAANMTLSDAILVLSLLIALGSGLVGRLRTSALAGPQRRVVVVALLILAGGLIGGAIRSPDNIAGDVGLRFVVAVLVIATLVTAIVDSREAWLRVAWWYAAGATVSAAVALSGGDTLAGRAIGLANHPNHFGSTMLLAIFLTIPVAADRTRLRCALTPPMMVVLVAGLIASGSRGALLALATGIGTLLLFRGVRSVPLFLAMTCCAAIVVVSLPGALSGDSALRRAFVPSAYEVESDDARRAYYRTAFRLIRENPLFGGGFADVFKFHNVPLQLTVASGFLGIAALGMLGRLMYKSIRSTMNDRSVLAQTCGACLIAIATFHMFASSFFDRYLLFVLAIALAGCSTSLAGAPRNPVAPHESAEVLRRFDRLERSG